MRVSSLWRVGLSCFFIAPLVSKVAGAHATASSNKIKKIARRHSQPLRNFWVQPNEDAVDEVAGAANGEDAVPAVAEAGNNVVAEPVVAENQQLIGVAPEEQLAGEVAQVADVS